MPSRSFRLAWLIYRACVHQAGKGPQRVLRSGKTLVGAAGRLLIDCPAVGGRSASGSSAVWRREQGGLWPLRLAGPTGCTHFRDGLLAALGDCGTQLSPLARLHLRERDTCARRAGGRRCALQSKLLFYYYYYYYRRNDKKVFRHVRCNCAGPFIAIGCYFHNKGGD